MTYETACAQAIQTAAAWEAAGLAAVTAGAEVARLERLANTAWDALAAARERAATAYRAEEEAWVLQWYPDTPIGFNALAASSLTALLTHVFSGEGCE